VSGRRCCGAESGSPDGEAVAKETTRAGVRPRPFFRRLRDAAGWVVPGAVLVLLPKCPVCIAAYVALATGVGISVSAASSLRTAVVIICASSLSFIAARRVRRYLASLSGIKGTAR